MSDRTAAFRSFSDDMNQSSFVSFLPTTRPLVSQSEEALQATRLVLPRCPGSTAFLHNEEMVFASPTCTGSGGLPDEKISFSSPGEPPASRISVMVQLGDGVRKGE